MMGLFDNDPVFKGIKRDRKGRFATAEKAMYDKAISERYFLTFLVEKYKRIANASSRAFIGQQKIIANQSRIIADLRKELAKLKKLKNVRQRIR